MNPWDTLHGLVDEEVWISIGGQYASFQQTMGTGDVDLFAQYLYKTGKLSKDSLGEVLRRRGRPELGDPKTLRHRRDAPDAATFVPRSPEQGYALLGKVGEGSMGRVFVAKDRDLNRKVAFKQISADYISDERIRTRFLNEAQITAQLDHPNIIPVYSLEVNQDGKLGYAMKLVEGRTLRQFMLEARASWENGQPLDPSQRRGEVIEIVLKVCDAIGYAHSRNVVHRDLKPDNIMVGAFGEVYVMDWGLARVMGAPELGGKVSGEHGGLTRVGDAVGTPAYMSPEQAQGKNDRLDGGSDQYALGLILQELLTLQSSVLGKTVRDVMKAAASGEREVPRHRYSAPLPPEILAIVAKACAFRVEDRYATLKAMADDLRNALQGRPVSAYRVPFWRLVLVRRSHPWFWVIAGLIFVGASLVGLFVVGLLGMEWLVGG